MDGMKIYNMYAREREREKEREPLQREGDKVCRRGPKPAWLTWDNRLN